MMPSVSALCPTYGRTALLEESIESFLRQDYAGPMELIVLNDLPDQILDWPEAPGHVRIVNAGSRFPSLGNKRNATAALACHDYLITWSDDDIHLPGRITENVAALARGEYVTEGRFIFNHRPKFELKRGRMCGPFLMQRKEFWELGGIPPLDTGEDVAFLKAVREKPLRIAETERVNYIYRWATGRFHASGHDKKPDAWQRIERQVQDTLRSGAEPRGRVRLRPQWREDYVEAARKAEQQA